MVRRKRPIDQHGSKDDLKGSTIVVQESKMMLLPPHPSKCQECACEHEPQAPHNPTSMFYQMKFHEQHGRWPDQNDASAHCSDEYKEWLTKKLLFCKMAANREPFPENLVQELVVLEDKLFPKGAKS